MDIFTVAGRDRLSKDNVLKLEQIINWNQVSNYLKNSKLRSDLEPVLKD
ncbi:hypothetical protein [Rickettsia amblyommatis]|uniref:Uncharacterized protein n=2 Tax=Rickettsia amblyommatis TaxID=33989 RepID=H8K5L3_RICAG|nr:hypothetical protein [Rickettsia amblyommatis]AFC69807.1 hypothetical protein MCE_04610 [Rickettsia amblyommatis str. GAT-30V]KJV62257.1 hypothetical protein APHACPA_1278 [Rickettsia amblyommatis str. Ac/Pa]KJV93102.1 hypothetical protein RAMDARK_0952 [Rickettsia amblyommatis str. Darkwater]